MDRDKESRSSNEADKDASKQLCISEPDVDKSKEMEKKNYVKVRLDDFKTFKIVKLNSLIQFDPTKFDPKEETKLFYSLANTNYKVQVYEILDSNDNSQETYNNNNSNEIDKVKSINSSHEVNQQDADNVANETIELSNDETIQNNNSEAIEKDPIVNIVKDKLMCKNTNDDCNPKIEMENNEKIMKDANKMSYEDKMKKISGYIEDIKSGLNNLEFIFIYLENEENQLAKVDFDQKKEILFQLCQKVEKLCIVDVNEEKKTIEEQVNVQEKEKMELQNKATTSGSVVDKIGKKRKIKSNAINDGQEEAVLNKKKKENNEIQQSENPDDEPLEKRDISSLPKYKKIDKKVHFGKGLFIDQKEWKEIKKITSYPIMSYRIAMALLPKDLNTYTFDLKKCKEKCGIKRELFPNDVLEVIKDVIRDDVVKQGMSEEMQHEIVKDVKNSISKKIRRMNE